MQIERQLQGTLLSVFSNLIKEKGLEKRISVAQEEFRADILLRNAKTAKSILFVELKDPTAKDGKTVFDNNVFVRELERAQEHEIRYFGTCNFLACAFFDIKHIKDRAGVSNGFFTINDIVKLRNNYVPTKEIENKLKNIAEYYLARAIEIIDNKPISFSSLDELFVFKIRKLIEIYAAPISEKVWENYKSDKIFECEINKYTQDQLWNKPQIFEEIENLTHISLLMLISKLIFYKSYVDNQTWHNLSPMRIPDEMDNADNLANLIWNYFDTFKNVTGNFELLIGERSEIIFKIPFVSDEVIELVKNILETEQQYDFSKIPFDIIGRIFEELIREDERHKLGQYFTPPDVIDLINTFAIHNGRDKVFDPSCGSGTFLVRAYERKRILYEEENKKGKHEVLLNEIYGNDLSNYPAYLSMLNLSMRNTRRASYPRITNKDFFAIMETSRLEMHDSDGNKERRILPKFDAIIGNPPYTRQEDIGTMQGTINKEQIQTLISKECHFTPSQRTSIYAYFFYHATTFLREGGYLAYICQNSWLDTDYGTDLQKYLLRTYEIIAVIDSEVERFFPSASVNTTIVILRKQQDENIRNHNTVKFVYMKKTLREILRKYKGCETLHEFIDEAERNVENDFIRINCIAQQTLSDYSKWGQFLRAPKIYFDILEKGKDIFKDLNSKKGISKIQRGITTGCNDFFYGKEITDEKYLPACVNNFAGFQTLNELKEDDLMIFKNGLNECWLIERELINTGIKLTRDIKHYIIDEINEKDVIFYVNQLVGKKKDDKDNLDIKEYRRRFKIHYPFAYRYVEYGEQTTAFGGTKVSQKKTCQSRKVWWNLGGQKEQEFVLLRFRDKRNWSPIIENNSILGDVFFYGTFKQKTKKKLYAISLNSTFSILETELLGRVNLGDGLLTTYGSDLKKLQVINKENKALAAEISAVYESLKGIEVKSIFEELGANKSDEINLQNVVNYRLAIDQLFLKLLGYGNEKERENILHQIYAAAIELINARSIKAHSQKTVKTERNQVAFEVYAKQLNDMLLEGKYEARETLTFAAKLEKLIMQITRETKLQKKIFDTYWKSKFGKAYNKKEVADTNQIKLF